MDKLYIEQAAKEYAEFIFQDSINTVDDIFNAAVDFTEGAEWALKTIAELELTAKQKSDS